MRVAKILRFQDPSEIEERSTLIEVELEPTPQFTDYSLIEPENKKALRTFVNTLKGSIRGSIEYREYVKGLKDHKGLDRCGYHPNITVDDGFSIHAHHYPYTLEDIIYTVIYSRAATNKDLKMTSIVDEVNKLHFLDMIGLYPFCETCHEYEHSLENDDFIPLDLLYGGPELFFDIYGEYMTEELRNKSKTYFNADQAYDIIKSNIPMGLVRHYIYVKHVEQDDCEYMSLEKIAQYVEEVLSA